MWMFMSSAFRKKLVWLGDASSLDDEMDPLEARLPAAMYHISSGAGDILEQSGMFASQNQPSALGTYAQTLTYTDTPDSVSSASSHAPVPLPSDDNDGNNNNNNNNNYNNNSYNSNNSLQESSYSSSSSSFSLSYSRSEREYSTLQPLNLSSRYSAEVLSTQIPPWEYLPIPFLTLIAAAYRARGLEIMEI